MKQGGFISGVILGAISGYVIPMIFGAKGVHDSPAPCNNGGCMGPMLIGFPIASVIAEGGTFGLGVALGEVGMAMYGISKAL